MNEFSNSSSDRLGGFSAISMDELEQVEGGFFSQYVQRAQAMAQAMPPDVKQGLQELVKGITSQPL